jgi:hypothetical protein
LAPFHCRHSLIWPLVNGYRLTQVQILSGPPTGRSGSVIFGKE